MNKQNSIKELRSSDVRAAARLFLPVILAVTGILLSRSGNIWLYVTGQLLLSVFFFQCFILLHECGHFSFFKMRWLNELAGNVFAFISVIPFRNWILVHNLHHRWTGWRDKDPTTASTVNRKFTWLGRTVINFSWVTWLPLFTIAYRTTNYWHVGRLKKFIETEKLAAVRIPMILQLAAYCLLIFFSWPLFLHYILPAYIMSLVISDVFILSQHSHVEMQLANGAEVKPLKYSQQVKFTRSLYISRFFAEYVWFNFNLHEIHHAHPGLPAYHLQKADTDTMNIVSFSSYLRDAKSMKGTEFIFSSSSAKIGKRKS